MNSSDAMTPSPARIPNNNVLDLRRLVAERQAAKRPRRWRSPSFLTPPPEAPRPRPSNRDWSRWRREVGKFLVAAAAVAVAVAVLWLGAEVVQAGQQTMKLARQGVGSLAAATADLGQARLEQASSTFSKADQQFQQAQQALSTGMFNQSNVSRWPILGRRYERATKFLTLGRQLSQSGRTLAGLLPPTTGVQPAVTIQADGVIQGSVGVLSSVLAHRSQTESILGTLISAAQQLVELSPREVPAAYRQRFAVWQRILRDLGGSDQRFDALARLVFNLLAPAEPQEYLVIFQNNDELRPTGGFAGTFLLVKFDRGSFTILDAPGNGPYALTDQTPRTSLPPQPLLALNPFWAFQDANWFLDAPTSAAFLIDFYNQARGFKPDGVMFLTPQLMEDLLRITGPLRPAKYQVDVTADNFVRATEQQVEFGYDKAANNPKQFLIDLVPTLLQKLSTLSGPDGLKALAVFLRGADRDNLTLYSRDPAMTKIISAVGWDGQVATPSGDYLAVVDTNLGGGKTDRVIRETVEAKVTVESGQLRHEVTVSRRHGGQVGDRLTGVTNTDFIRVYAPADAQFVSISGATPAGDIAFQSPDPAAKLTGELLAAEGQTLVDPQQGYRITHESGKTVFGAWSRLVPGQDQSVTFRYTTPLPSGEKQKTWQLYWQHQPGAPTRTWTVSFDAGRQGKIASTLSTVQTSVSGRQAIFKTDSTYNRTFGVFFR